MAGRGCKDEKRWQQQMKSLLLIQALWFMEGATNGGLVMAHKYVMVAAAALHR